MLLSTEKIGVAISVIASALMVLSTAYDFNYLFALNLSFNDLPTTLSDHIRSAIVWLPTATLYIAAIVIYDFCIKWIEDGQTEEEIAENPKIPRFIKLFRKSATYLIGIFTVSVILLQLLFTNSYVFFYFFGGTFYAFGALLIVRHKRLGLGISKTYRRAIIIVPGIVIWVSLLGYTSGYLILQKSNPEWLVTLISNEGTELKPIFGMRRFSSSTILVDSNKIISVVSNDSILSSQLIDAGDSRETNICRWIGLFCANQVIIEQN